MLEGLILERFKLDAFPTKSDSQQILINNDISWSFSFSFHSNLIFEELFSKNSLEKRQICSAFVDILQLEINLVL